MKLLGSRAVGWVYGIGVLLGLICIVDMFQFPRRSWVASEQSRAANALVIGMLTVIPLLNFAGVLYYGLNIRPKLERRGPGGVAAIPSDCPYCSAELSPRPQRKKKCPACGEVVYVKSRPSDRQKRLVTEAEAKVIEREWEAYHQERELGGKLEAIGVPVEEQQQIERDMRDAGRPLIPGDVFWAAANRRLLEAMRRSDFQEMSQIYFQQALHLFEEGKDHIEVARMARECELRRYVSSGVVVQVEVLTAGEQSCPECRRLSGQRLTIERALHEMPIPVRACTTRADLGSGRRGWCRCGWSPIVDF